MGGSPFTIVNTCNNKIMLILYCYGDHVCITICKNGCCSTLKTNYILPMSIILIVIIIIDIIIL